MSLTLPLPPNPDDGQYRSNPLAYSRAFYNWSLVTKGKIEQHQPIQNGVAVSGPQIGDVAYRGSNAWLRLAGSSATAGQVMTYGTSSAPVWRNISSNFATGTGIALTGTTTETINTSFANGTGISINGTATQTFNTSLSAGTGISITGTATQTIALSNPGYIQQARFQTGTLATGTNTIPYDDTPPQIGEGDQYMSVTIAPTGTTGRLVVQALGAFANSNTVNMTMALFQGTSTNALASIPFSLFGGGFVVPIPLTHQMAPTGTATTTFQIRAGGNGAGTTTFNGVAGGRLYGGVLASSLIITEYAS